MRTREVDKIMANTFLYEFLYYTHTIFLYVKLIKETYILTQIYVITTRNTQLNLIMCIKSAYSFSLSHLTRL